MEDGTRLNEKLEALYSDVAGDASFSRPEVLYKKAKETGLPVSLKAVKDFLKAKSSYTHFRPIRKRAFRRNKLVPRFLHETWFIDLAYLPTKDIQCGKYKFLLIVAEALSRQIYAKLLTSRKSKPVTDAFLQIVDEVGLPPAQVVADAGSEFISSHFKGAIRDLHIGFRPSNPNNPSKSFLAELSIKILMRRIFKVLEEQNHRKLTPELLSEILHGLNARPIKSLGGHSPDSVTLENQLDVAEEQRRAAEALKPLKPKLSVGAMVVLRRAQAPPFQKGYKKAVQDEERFVIASITVPKAGGVPVLRLRDRFGVDVSNWYYEDQVIEVA